MSRCGATCVYKFLSSKLDFGHSTENLVFKYRFGMHCLPVGHQLVTQKTIQALKSTSAVTAIKWASVVLIRLSCVKSAE